MLFFRRYRPVEHFFLVLALGLLSGLVVPGESYANGQETNLNHSDSGVMKTWICRSQIQNSHDDPKLTMQCETATEQSKEDHEHLQATDLRTELESTAETAPICEILGRLDQAKYRLKKANNQLGRILDRNKKYITWFLFFMGEKQNIRDANRKRKEARHQLIHEFDQHEDLLLDSHQKRAIVKITRNLKRDAEMGPVLAKKREKRNLKEIFLALKKRHTIVREIVKPLDILTSHPYCSERASAKAQAQNTTDTL